MCSATPAPTTSRWPTSCSRRLVRAVDPPARADSFCPLGPVWPPGWTRRALSVDLLTARSGRTIRSATCDLQSGPAGEPHLPRHDPAARRRDPVRHVGRCRLDEAGQPRRGGDRGHRPALQPLRLSRQRISTRRTPMKIAVIGAGAIGGLVGAQARPGRRDVTFIVRGRNLEAIRRNAASSSSRPTATSTRAQRAGHRRLRRRRAAGRRGPRDEGPPARGGGDDCRKLLGPETVDRADAERHPFWYFQQHGGPFEGGRVAQRRSQRRSPPASPRPRDRLRGLPGLRAGGARRRAPHRGRPVPARRARRPRRHRARASASRPASRAPASRRRCSTTSAPRSGSSSGAT